MLDGCRGCRRPRGCDADGSISRTSRRSSGRRRHFASRSSASRSMRDTCPRASPGLRTIFNGFHHFRPEDATAVLRNAAEARPADRDLRDLPADTPLHDHSAAPHTDLRHARHAVDAAVSMGPAPVDIPRSARAADVLWDGFVSQLRAYTTTELEALGAEADARASWRAGQVPMGTTPGTLTYLLGYPAESRVPERSV